MTGNTFNQYVIYNKDERKYHRGGNVYRDTEYLDSAKWYKYAGEAKKYAQRLSKLEQQRFCIIELEVREARVLDVEYDSGEGI